jgi:hypothetical protein
MLSPWSLGGARWACVQLVVTCKHAHGRISKDKRLCQILDSGARSTFSSLGGHFNLARGCWWSCMTTIRDHDVLAPSMLDKTLDGKDAIIVVSGSVEEVQFRVADTNDVVNWLASSQANSWENVWIGISRYKIHALY